MPIKKIDELKANLSSLLGDDTSDTALSFLEDFNDTMCDIKTNSTIDWKTKYEDNDKQWREKYRNRFFEGSAPVFEEKEEEPKRTLIKYEDLFQ